MASANPIQSIRTELKQTFIEREELIDGTLAALLAREHVLLIGPPGTAKSMLADELCKRIDGADYFQWLLTKFTTPEEIFGPISLKALERDEYTRIPRDKLPVAHVAFLDEIFKANSSILNALLSLINERKFHNGDKPQDAPLISMFGASNELPDEEELTALYDRFMLRYLVKYLEEDANFVSMLALKQPKTRTRITLKELDEIQDEVTAIDLPDLVMNLILTVRNKLKKENIIPSDRRFRNSLNLLRAVAYMEGRSHVTDSDLMILCHVLWTTPDDIPVVENVVYDVANPFDRRADEFLQQAQEISAYARRDWADEDERTKAGIEAHTKFKKIHSRIGDVIKRASQEGRSLGKIEDVRVRIERMHNEILENCLGLEEAP
ncbi:MAG: AAA family ATPase [Deltaproteobacteria bacterium]|nr:AAA family ATPase [Deltaproteobacteria bacterium]